MQKFPRLEEAQRRVLSGFSSDVGLRVRRCISWLTRAEQASEDCDAEHRRSLISTATNTSATHPRTRIPPVVHPHRPAPPQCPTALPAPTGPASPPPDVPGCMAAPQSIVMHFRGAEWSQARLTQAADHGRISARYITGRFSRLQQIRLTITERLGKSL